MTDRHQTNDRPQGRTSDRPQGQEAQGLGGRVMREPNTRNAPIRAFAKRATGLCTAFALACAATGLAPIAPGTTGPANAAESFVTIGHGEGHRTRDTKLGLNKSMVIDLPAAAQDVLVANPDVADAVVRTARRIYVFGKAVGQTNVFVFGRSGEQIAVLDLDVERDISELTRTIGRLVPGSEVQAEMINDNVVLTGTVNTPAAAAKAVQLAEVFAIGGDRADPRSQGANQISLVQAFQPRISRVINLLNIVGEDQVHLKVTVAEVQRSVVKQLGIDSVFSRRVGDGLSFIGRAPAESYSRASPLAGVNAAISGLGDFGLQSDLRALEQTGVMRTLAEPSMTAISGEKAEFKVGGKFPVANGGSCDDPSTEANEKAYDFKEVDFGVKMAFKPVVLSSGRISLKVRTEVSEPTTMGMQGGMCANIVGVRERLADTTVELPSGGSMVIGGLVQDDVRQVVSGLPGLQRIPVFGSLFRSKEFVRNETELVIILTPYLVRPVAPSKLTRPDKNFAPAEDGAGLLLGRINRVYGTKSGKLPRGRYVGSIGFILD